MRIRDILFIASLVLGAFTISVVSGLYIKEAVSHPREVCKTMPHLMERPGKPKVWVNKTHCEKIAHRHNYRGRRYGYGPYYQPRINDDLDDRRTLRLHVPFVDLTIPLGRD